MSLVDHNVSIGDAKVEGSVVQVIKTWATLFPQELIVFDQQMRRERDLSNSKGMSDNRNLKHFGEIPAKLNALMVRRFGQTWHYDTKLRLWFWDHFQVGKIQKRERVLFNPRGALTV